MKTRKPNGVIYFIVYILFFPLLKLLFRLKVDRTNYNPPKGPFLVLSNHVSFMDFLLVMLSFYPRRLNAVAAQKFYFYRPLNRLLPLMGCIPKNLFDPDIRSIMRIKSVIKRGDRILLYPEGRCTTAGAYMGIHTSTGKLIKNLGVPVISCHIEGAYTCMPFWRDSLRFGRERLTVADLFTAQDTKLLSINEINNAIDARLGGFDTPAPRKPFMTFKARRLANGLQNLLYWCPKCGKELTLETEGCIIRCTFCGNTAEIDRTAVLTPAPGSTVPDSIQSWYREQTLYEKRKLSEDMPPINIGVTVRMPVKKESEESRRGVKQRDAKLDDPIARSRISGHAKTSKYGIMPCGTGILSLDSAGWRYNGELSGEPVSLFFPIDSVPALPFDPGDNFQIYQKGSFYAFTPEDKRLCSKYATIGECAYWRFASRVQMTPGRDGGFNK